MAICKKCGYHNIEGNKYCVNCGSTLEITKEYIEKVEQEKKTATVKYFGVFFTIFGGCITLGGLITWITSIGTITEDVSASVAGPFILIGGFIMIIGGLVYFSKN